MAKEEKVAGISKKTLTIILGAIFVIMLMGFVYNSGYTATGAITLDQQQTPSQQQTTNQQQTPQQNCQQVQVPYNDIEYYIVSEPYTDQVCQYQNLIYSVENWFINSVCSKRNWLGFCIEETWTCSFDINNHDTEGGAWKMGMTFFVDGSKIEKDPQTLYVYPQSSTHFSWDQVAGPTQNVTCGYSTLSVPQKQVCQYITKYRDVQQSRTVTKYRTETQCS